MQRPVALGLERGPGLLAITITTRWLVRWVRGGISYIVEDARVVVAVGSGEAHSFREVYRPVARDIELDAVRVELRPPDRVRGIRVVRLVQCENLCAHQVTGKLSV